MGLLPDTQVTPGMGWGLRGCCGNHPGKSYEPAPASSQISTTPVFLTLANKGTVFRSSLPHGPRWVISVYICACVCWCKCGSYRKTLSTISWVPSPLGFETVSHWPGAHQVDLADQPMSSRTPSSSTSSVPALKVQAQLWPFSRGFRGHTQAHMFM